MKIEGRIKKFHYVYTVVEAYRKQLQRLYDGKKLSLDNERLFKVFNRDFSKGYLKGDINRDMFIDNPRDNSATHLAALSGGSTNEAIDDAEKELYEEKSGIRLHVKSVIEPLSAGKVPLMMSVMGEEGVPLRVDIKTPGFSLSLTSEINLKSREGMSLNHREILKRFKALNDTEYFIEQVDLAYLQPGLFIPFSELTSLKKRILFFLRDSREHVDPVKLPALLRPDRRTAPPALSVLISSREDLHLCDDPAVHIYFQLPDYPSYKLAEWIELFRNNSNLIPWFSPLLIGEEFSAAVNFLQEVKPAQIVTNNTGIAFEARWLH